MATSIVLVSIPAVVGVTAFLALVKDTGECKPHTVTDKSGVEYWQTKHGELDENYILLTRKYEQLEKQYSYELSNINRKQEYLETWHSQLARRQEAQNKRTAELNRLFAEYGN